MTCNGEIWGFSWNLGEIVRVGVRHDSYLIILLGMILSSVLDRIGNMVYLLVDSGIV